MSNRDPELPAWASQKSREDRQWFTGYVAGLSEAIAIIRLGPPPGADARPWANAANSLQSYLDAVKRD